MCRFLSCPDPGHSGDSVWCGPFKSPALTPAPQPHPGLRVLSWWPRAGGLRLLPSSEQGEANQSQEGGDRSRLGAFQKNLRNAAVFCRPGIKIPPPACPLPPFQSFLEPRKDYSRALPSSAVMPRPPVSSHRDASALMLLPAFQDRTPPNRPPRGASADGLPMTRGPNASGRQQPKGGPCQGGRG